MPNASFGVIFKLSLEDLEDVVDGLNLKVGAAGDLLGADGKHLLGSVAADTDKGVDDPLFDFVGELLEIHILFIWSDFAVAVHVDVITRQLAGQLDVVAALADGEAHLIAVHIDVGEHVLIIEDDAGDLGWA